MATSDFYVNLSGPGGDGTIGSPFNFSQWQVKMQQTVVLVDDVINYHIKGYYFSASNVVLSVCPPSSTTSKGTINIKQWNGNDPWRIDCGGANLTTWLNHATISGGIIYANGMIIFSKGGGPGSDQAVSGYSMSVRTMVLKATQQINTASGGSYGGGSVPPPTTQMGYNTEFRGCYLSAPEIRISSGSFSYMVYPPFPPQTRYVDYVSTARYTDCCIITNIFTGGSAAGRQVGASYQNHYFLGGIATNQSDPVANSNCYTLKQGSLYKFNWLAQSLPSSISTVAQTDWDVSTLGIGIDSSVLVGIGAPSYTDYATGLWQEPRTGIGAFYFGVSVALDITSAPNLMGTEDVEWTYTPVVDYTGLETLGWTLTGAPGGMTVNALTGALSWTPAEGVLTSGEVTLTVTDGALSTSQKFTISIVPVNDAPLITSAPVLQATKNQLYLYQPDVYDPDSTTFVWTLINPQPGMVIDSATGLIQWLPTISGAQIPVGLYVQDDGSPVGIDDQAWTITVTPFITGQNFVGAYANSDITIQSDMFNVLDPDPSTLTVEVQEAAGYKVLPNAKIHIYKDVLPTCIVTARLVRESTGEVSNWFNLSISTLAKGKGTPLAGYLYYPVQDYDPYLGDPNNTDR